MSQCPNLIQIVLLTPIDEIAAVKERRYEKSTVNSTIWGVKIFKDWLREKNYSESFELLEPVQKLIPYWHSSM